MNWIDFTLRMLAALGLGALIGVERQWRQRLTGLRTNALVAVGSALFVMMGSLIPGGQTSQVAAYVISGIGFLGGGVILKDGFNIRGLNTAATLWCTAAVGTLAGLGLPLYAAIGAGGVLAANVILRPLARLINHSPAQGIEEEIVYRFRCSCRVADEARMRALILQNVNPDLALVSLHSHDREDGEGLEKARVDICAYFQTMGRKDDQLEALVSRLSLEPTVTAISWQITSGPQEAFHDEDIVASPPAHGR